MTDDPVGINKFRWNLTPGESADPEPIEPSVADPAMPVVPVAVPAPVRVPPTELSSAAPPSAALPSASVVDDWDVPTMASPVIPASVFPLAPAALQAPPSFVPPHESAREGVTEVLGAQSVGGPEPEGEAPEVSDIDVLFGHSDQVSAIPGAKASLSPGASPPKPGPQSEGNALTLYRRSPVTVDPSPSRGQKALIGIAIAVVASLVLVAMFLLGARIGQKAPSPEASTAPSASLSATPSNAGAGTGPVAVGDHPWDQLRGGECLTPYESPWEQNYTVVDCKQPHSGQMLAKGVLPGDADAVYPGLAELQASTSLLCAATTVIDYSASSGLTDVQIAASFPADAEQWDEGDRNYYCFVSRSGDAELVGSMAVSTG
ncbi:MAG: septum formation family protein [Rhodoglobus sp.]